MSFLQGEQDFEAERPGVTAAKRRPDFQKRHEGRLRAGDARGPGDGEGREGHQVKRRPLPGPEETWALCLGPRRETLGAAEQQAQSLLWSFWASLGSVEFTTVGAQECPAHAQSLAPLCCEAG